MINFFFFRLKKNIFNHHYFLNKRNWFFQASTPASFLFCNLADADCSRMIFFSPPTVTNFHFLSNEMEYDRGDSFFILNQMETTSNWMEYDRGDSFHLFFLFRFWTKWNSIWFRKSKGNLSPRSYPIQCERKWKYSFVSVSRKQNTFSETNVSI